MRRAAVRRAAVHRAAVRRAAVRRAAVRRSAVPMHLRFLYHVRTKVRTKLELLVEKNSF